MEACEHKIDQTNRQCFVCGKSELDIHLNPRRRPALEMTETEKTQLIGQVYLDHAVATWNVKPWNDFLKRTYGH